MGPIFLGGVVPNFNLVGFKLFKVMGWSKIFKAGGSKQILWEYFFHRLTSRAFWQQRALGEEAAGAEFHNPTSLCCVCKRSQCPAVQGVPMGHTMGHSAPCS